MTQQIISCLLLGCFFVMPLIFWTGHYHIFETAKTFIFSASILLACVIGGIACWRVGVLAIPRSRLTLAVGLYYLSTLGAWLLFPYTDTKYVGQVTCGVLLFLVISATAPHLQDRVIGALILAAFIASFIGILQFFGVTFVYGFQHYFGDLQLGALKGMRIFATFGHPNLLGGFCVVILPVVAVAMFEAFQAKRHVYGGYCVAVFAVTLIALLLSRTRAAWLGTACAFMLFGLLHVKHLHLIGTWLRRHWRIALCGIILSMFGIIALLRYAATTEIISIRFRSAYYSDTLAMIMEHPILGRGCGTFNVYYPRYRDNRAAAKAGEPFRDYRVEHPHNEHLEQLHDGGLFGYGLFLWMTVEAFRCFARRQTLRDAANAAALFGLLIDGLFSQNLRFSVIASLFWLLLGFANHVPDAPPIKLALPPRYQQPVSLIGIIIMLLFGMFGLRAAAHVMQSDASLKKGMTCYMNQQFPCAIAALTDATAHDRQNKSALYYLASAYKLIGRPEQAMAAYRDLLAIDPYFLRTNFFVANLYLQQNQPKRAQEFLERQISVDTMDWEAYALSALLAVQFNQTEQAIGYLREIQTIHHIQKVDKDALEQVNLMLQQLTMPKK